jgi:nucleotidyltransferase/DNA polymerase involved in DNA repair
VIAALVIPAFDLRAALRLRPGLETEPAALAPLPGTEPLLGSVTSAAQAKGVRTGMRLGEALATCPGLVLVEQDPAGVEQAWEEVLRRLEDAGFAVEPAGPGTAYFETRGVERLYGGLEPALRRALAAVGPAWDARVGAAERRLAALAAANVARAGQLLIVSDDRTRTFLAPLPLTLLPLERERYEELEELGVRTIGQLAGLPGGAVAERLGPDGRRAWSLARGERDVHGLREHGVAPRRPPVSLVETLEFPDAVGQELTLRRGLGVLVDGLLARPERAGRPPRKLALWARLVGGASWRRAVTLREPTADPDRLRLALGPRLAELPAPVLKLRLEAVELADSGGEQLELVRAGDGSGAAGISAGVDSANGKLKQGLRQVKAAVGAGGVSTVVEVAPWSRIPEARALLVPRDD